MALFGSVATVQAQVAPRDVFLNAFAYLDEVFRTGSSAAERVAKLPLGETHRVDLAGGAFALEQAYKSKARNDGFFESHRKYIDVQVIVVGEEVLEVVDVSRAKVNQPYVAERDLITYHDTAAATPVRLHAGEAAIFFPADIHMPGLRTGAEGAVVRKVVVKVPVPTPA